MGPHFLHSQHKAISIERYVYSRTKHDERYNRPVYSFTDYTHTVQVPVRIACASCAGASLSPIGRVWRSRRHSVLSNGSNRVVHVLDVNYEEKFQFYFEFLREFNGKVHSVSGSVCSQAHRISRWVRFGDSKSRPEFLQIQFLFLWISQVQKLFRTPKLQPQSVSCMWLSCDSCCEPSGVPQNFSSSAHRLAVFAVLLAFPLAGLTSLLKFLISFRFRCL